MALANKIKKIVGIVSISCCCVAALIGLSLLFSLFKFSTWLGGILLTILTFFVGSLLLLNSVEAIKRRNFSGYISLGLIGLSVLLILVQIWWGVIDPSSSNGLYSKIVVVVTACSILISVIVSKMIILNKHILVVQIIGYVTLAILEGYVVFIILGIINFAKLNLFIVANGIICGVFFVIMSVKGKTLETDESKEMISIPLKEYNYLKDRINELEKELKNYK